VTVTVVQFVQCEGKMETKRYHETMYDRTSGKDRAYHYAEWRKIVAGQYIMTAPEAITAPKSQKRYQDKG